MLVITVDDASIVLHTASTTRFNQKRPMELLEAFTRCLGVIEGDVVRDVIVMKSDFDRCIRELVPAALVQDETDKKLLSHMLSAVYYVQEDSGPVKLAELISGLSLLCKGSKSSKLAFSFQLFASPAPNQSKYVPADLTAYLSSFVRAIFMTSSQGATMTASAMHSAISALVARAVKGVLQHAGEGCTRVSFEDVGGWYNGGGYEVLPWLELLDLSKWTMRVAQQQSGAGARLPEPPPKQEASKAQLHPPASEASEGYAPRVAYEFTLWTAQLEDESVPPSLLTITEEDVAALLDVVSITGLETADPAMVGGLFMAAAGSSQELASPEPQEKGMLAKADFDAAIRSVVPGELVDDADKETCSMLLSSVFYAFDRGDSSCVDAAELAAGFALLCSGNKSAKLAYGFELLDVDQDDSLPFEGVVRLLRSVLSCLMGVSSSAATMNASELNRVIETAAVRTAEVVLADAAAARSKAQVSSISFDDLARWYTEGGYKMCSWLELLDLSKWIVQETDTGVGNDDDDDDDDAQEGEAEEEEDEEDSQYSGVEDEDDDEADDSLEEPTVLFRFLLSPHLELSISGEDVRFAERFMLGSGLAGCEPYEAASLLQGLGEVTRDTFIQTFTFGTGALAAATLGPLFDTLQLQMSRGVESAGEEGALIALPVAVAVADLQCAVTFFCGGSKSSKLCYAHSLFTSAREDGEAISRRAVGQLLSDLLAALSSCMGQMRALRGNGLVEAINAARDHALFDMFEREGAAFEARQSVTFEEFGSWYNKGGFEIVPWLEMLDLKKWLPELQSSSADEEGVESPPPDPRVQLPQDVTRFHFRLCDSTEPVHLVLTSEDVEAVMKLASTGLAATDPSQICSTLLETSEGGVLTKAQFDAVMQVMVPHPVGASENEMMSYSVLLSSVFFAFDRNNCGDVDVLDIAAGFTLLCSGNKSSKLAFAFDLLDEDGDDLLSRRGLWRFVRCFLTVLMSLSCSSSAVTAKKLTAMINDAAVWTSARIFAQAAPNTKNKISFDDFAAWYGGGGFQTSAWLELLDLSKWEVAAV
ncbi:unnamed protein product [Chrysoparadoxa australica]